MWNTAAVYRSRIKHTANNKGRIDPCKNQFCIEMLRDSIDDEGTEKESLFRSYSTGNLDEMKRTIKQSLISTALKKGETKNRKTLSNVLVFSLEIKDENSSKLASGVFRIA